MASISIRKIDEETIQRLRLQAARHGVSMEEEVRRILKRAVKTPERLGDYSVSMFGAKAGERLQIPPREVHEPPDFQR